MIYCLILKRKKGFTSNLTHSPCEPYQSFSSNSETLLIKGSPEYYMFYTLDFYFKNNIYFRNKPYVPEKNDLRIHFQTQMYKMQETPKTVSHLCICKELSCPFTTMSSLYPKEFLLLNIFRDFFVLWNVPNKIGSPWGKKMLLHREVICLLQPKDTTSNQKTLCSYLIKV